VDALLFEAFARLGTPPLSLGGVPRIGKNGCGCAFVSVVACGWGYCLGFLFFGFPGMVTLLTIISGNSDAVTSARLNLCPSC